MVISVKESAIAAECLITRDLILYIIFSYFPFSTPTSSTFLCTNSLIQKIFVAQTEHAGGTRLFFRPQSSFALCHFNRAKSGACHLQLIAEFISQQTHIFRRESVVLDCAHDRGPLSFRHGSAVSVCCLHDNMLSLHNIFFLDSGPVKTLRKSLEQDRSHDDQ